MRTKLTILTSGFILLIALLGLYVIPISSPPKVLELKVAKVNGVWKVVDATSNTKVIVKVNKKDAIVWTANGTDTFFQFPDKLFNPASADDSLHEGYTKFLKDGHKLKLIVKDDAQPGMYEYAVFCTADGVYAKGDSSPVIIIE